MLIGEATQVKQDEFKRDLKKPFADLSGFDYERDAKGKPVKTGRREQWFEIYAEVDLCKIGNDCPAFSALLDDVHKLAKEKSKKHVIYFYGTGNGNSEVKDDNYSDAFYPVSAREVLRALKLDNAEINYRRFSWAIVLLEAILKDDEDAQVIFYGH